MSAIPPDLTIVCQLQELGVHPGGVLLVHASYRAVRPVIGGPLGLIASLQAALGPTGTLVMPTMTDGSTVFDPTTTPSVGMGVTAELFWRQTGVIRSTHPGGSFAAAGPLAHTICAPQVLSPPHGPDSPVGRVYDLDGEVLLLGVEHSENTTLHLAEALAGVPYTVSYPCLVVREGRVEELMIAESDHCCRGFRIADSWLRERQQQREGPVGRAHARLFRSKNLVALALKHLAHDPLLFLCAPSGCSECDAARASVSPTPDTVGE